MYGPWSIAKLLSVVTAQVTESIPIMSTFGSFSKYYKGAEIGKKHHETPMFLIASTPGLHYVVDKKNCAIWKLLPYHGNFRERSALNYDILDNLVRLVGFLGIRNIYFLIK